MSIVARPFWLVNLPEETRTPCSSLGVVVVAAAAAVVVVVAAAAAVVGVVAVAVVVVLYCSTAVL